MYGLDSAYSGLGSVADAYECSNESLGSTKGWEFLISRVAVGFLRISWIYLFGCPNSKRFRLGLAGYKVYSTACEKMTKFFC